MKSTLPPFQSLFLLISCIQKEKHDSTQEKAGIKNQKHRVPSRGLGNSTAISERLQNLFQRWQVLMGSRAGLQAQRERWLEDWDLSPINTSWKTELSWGHRYVQTDTDGDDKASSGQGHLPEGTEKRGGSTAPSLRTPRLAAVGGSTVCGMVAEGAEPATALPKAAAAERLLLPSSSPWPGTAAFCLCGVVSVG